MQEIFLSCMKSPFPDVLEDVMFTLCFSDTGMKKWERTKCREDAVKTEAATGCRVSKWSVMVHLMAHATVIARSVFQVFPKILKKQCHSSVTWECSFYADPAVIFWSRNESPNTRPAGWYQPNHFIPLVESRSSSTGSETTSSSSSSDIKDRWSDEIAQKEY